MDIPAGQARALFATARVARLATADAEGRPHLVPVTFAVEGESVYFAIDGKPKRGPQLRRLRNIEANPRVSLLVDEYTEDWQRLWWVRADGLARVHPAAADRTEADALDHSATARSAHAAALLRAKYPQYADLAAGPGGDLGPVVEIAVDRWTGWRFSACG